MSVDSESMAGEEPAEPLKNLTPSHAWEGLPLCMPPVAETLIQTAQARLKSVRCFDYVPSNYHNAWQCFSLLASRTNGRSSDDDWLEETLWHEHVRQLESPAAIRFCEWGSGLGVAAGLASLVGFNSMGIELDAELAQQSRELLGQVGLETKIVCGSYYEIDQLADLYYVYAWPSQRAEVIERFLTLSPPHALLLICDGQDRLRVMSRWS